MLYPLKFHPIFKDKIWGGEKIRTVLKKDFTPLPNCGESWEISGVQNNESIVRNGYLKGKSLKDIINEFKGKLLGITVFDKFKDVVVREFGALLINPFYVPQIVNPDKNFQMTQSSIKLFH